MSPRPEYYDAEVDADAQPFLPSTAPHRTQPQKKEQASTIPRAKSMLEMNGTQDRVGFDEDTTALSAEQEDGDNGCFVDAGDNGHSRRRNFVPIMIVSLDDPDRTVHLPPSGGSCMRRVDSVCSMTPSIQTISEEGDTESGLCASINGRKPFMRRSKSSARMKTSASHSRTPETGLDGSISARQSYVPMRHSFSSASTSSGSLTQSPETDLGSSYHSETTESGIGASINGRKPFMRRSKSSARMNRSASHSRTPETGLDGSISARQSFVSKRHPSCPTNMMSIGSLAQSLETDLGSSYHSETTETGLDASTNRRKPFMRRSMSSARMNRSASHSRTPETGLDGSISARQSFVSMRHPSCPTNMMSIGSLAQSSETGLGASISSRKPFVRRSMSSARINRSASYSRTPETGLDGSISARQSSVSMRHSASSASMMSNWSLTRSSKTNLVGSIHSETTEDGLDASINSRKPCMRRSMSSIKMKRGASQTGLWPVLRFH